MPYKDATARRLHDKLRKRESRRLARAGREAVALELGGASPAPEPLADPAALVASWSREKLTVPAGHPLAGRPMELPGYGLAFLEDALAPGCREALFCCARKQAKSAIAAVLVLALLRGPLRRPGLRIGVTSVNREKAAELLRQCREIAEASRLDGITFRRSPAPGWIVTDTGTAEFLSADKSSGHASGFDLALVDELGLLTERDRALVNGIRTATSARDGRFLALSIRGDSPLLEEMLDRRELDTCAVHLHAPPEPKDGKALDISDPSVWADGNPGIAVGIKSAAWMADEAARVEATPSDRASFMALDLNCPGRPAREMLVTDPDFAGCQVEELPPRTGEAILGLDVGGASSATAAACIWPATGRCEFWLGYGSSPDLLERGRRDGIGARYENMRLRGELKTYGGRVTDVPAFLRDVARDLEGATVRRVLADDYKAAEVADFIDAAALPWPLTVRRTGTGKQGSQDVRAAQRLLIGRKVKFRESLALSSAISNAVIRRDPNGNPAVDKATTRGRIDLASAFVLSAGMAESLMDRPTRPHFV